MAKEKIKNISSREEYLALKEKIDNPKSSDDTSKLAETIKRVDVLRDELIEDAIKNLGSEKSKKYLALKEKIDNPKSSDDTSKLAETIKRVDVLRDELIEDAIKNLGGSIYDEYSRSKDESEDNPRFNYNMKNKERDDDRVAELREVLIENMISQAEALKRSPETIKPAEVVRKTIIKIIRETNDALKRSEQSAGLLMASKDKAKEDVEEARRMIKGTEDRIIKTETEAIKKVVAHLGFGKSFDGKIEKKAAKKGLTEEDVAQLIADEIGGLQEASTEELTRVNIEIPKRSRAEAGAEKESDHLRDHFNELLDKEDNKEKLLGMYQLLRVTKNEENPNDEKLKKEIEAEIKRLNNLFQGTIKEAEPRSGASIENPGESPELREQFDDIKEKYSGSEGRLIMLENLLSQIDAEAKQEDLKLKGEVLAEIDRIREDEESTGVVGVEPRPGEEKPEKIDEDERPFYPPVPVEKIDEDDRPFYPPVPVEKIDEDDSDKPEDEQEDELGPEGETPGPDEGGDETPPAPEEVENKGYSKSDRYHANYAKIKVANPDFSDEQIDQIIKYAEADTLRESESVKIGVDGLVKALADGDLEGEDLKVAMEQLAYETGLSQEQISAIFGNQVKQLELAAIQRIKKPKLKNMLLKAGGYMLAGVGIGVATGGIAWVAGLGAGSLGLLRLAERMRAGNIADNRIKKELDAIRKEIKSDSSQAEIFENNIISQIAMLKQDSVNNMDSQLSDLDKEISALEKRVVEGDSSAEEELKEKRLSQSLNQFRALFSYLAQDPNYEGFSDEEKISMAQRAIAMRNIDRNQALREQEQFALTPGWARNLDKFLSGKWGEGDEKSSKVLRGISKFLGGGETNREKTATMAVFVMAGQIARHAPIIRNVLMGYAGAKGGELLASWLTSEKRNPYRVLKQISVAELSGKTEDPTKADDPFVIARTMLVDSRFKKNNPTEYAKLREAMDKHEQSQVEASQRVGALSKALIQRNNQLEKTLIEQRGKSKEKAVIRASMTIGGAVAGAFLGEALNDVTEYLKRSSGSSEAVIVHETTLATQATSETMDAGGGAIPVDSEALAPVAETAQESVADAPQGIPSEAIIGKGEGVEHALARQLIANPEKYGFKGSVDDPSAVRQWAGGEAHRIALKTGYVDSETGQQIRVRTDGIDKAAYVLGKNDSGEYQVAEKFLDQDGKAESGDIRTSGGSFKETPAPHEYLHNKTQAGGELAQEVASPESAEAVAGGELSPEEVARATQEEIRSKAIESQMQMRKNIIAGMVDKKVEGDIEQIYKHGFWPFKGDQMYEWNGTTTQSGIRDMEVSNLLNNSYEEANFGEHFKNNLDLAEVNNRKALHEYLQDLHKSSGVEPNSGETTGQYILRAQTEIALNEDQAYNQLLAEKMALESPITETEVKTAKDLGFEHQEDGVKFPERFVHGDGSPVIFQATGENEAIVGYENREGTLVVEVLDESGARPELKEYAIRISDDKVFITNPGSEETELMGIQVKEGVPSSESSMIEATPTPTTPEVVTEAPETVGAEAILEQPLTAGEAQELFGEILSNNPSTEAQAEEVIKLITDQKISADQFLAGMLNNFENSSLLRNVGDIENLKAAVEIVQNPNLHVPETSAEASRLIKTIFRVVARK